MEELTPEQRFHAEEPEITVPKDIISGKPIKEIIDGLIQLDYTEDDALEFVRKIEERISIVKNNPEKIDELRKESKKYYAIGLPLILFSVLLFFLTKLIPGVFFLATGFGFILKASGDNTSLSEIKKLLDEQAASSKNPDDSQK